MVRECFHDPEYVRRHDVEKLLGEGGGGGGGDGNTREQACRRALAKHALSLYSTLFARV
jgi:hypothetical protein